jgi:hypothetical protein
MQRHYSGFFEYESAEGNQFSNCVLLKSLNADEGSNAAACLGVTFHNDGYCTKGAVVDLIVEQPDLQHLTGWKREELVMDIGY